MNARLREPRTAADCLPPRAHDAARRLVARVRREVPAELVQALLFGSRARGSHRPDSDVDLLLLFRALPPDREPQAAMAEALAEGVARETGVPVTVWSVSLPDLAAGVRTPMLVDALDDAVPLWPADAPPPRIPFTPADARHCAAQLLARVREGSGEAADARRRGDAEAAARRARDDLVRLCTAALLGEGVTRPRRADAVRRFAARHPRAAANLDDILRWAATSFGPPGAEDDAPVPPPPGGWPRLAHAMDVLLPLARNAAARPG